MGQGFIRRKDLTEGGEGIGHTEVWTESRVSNVGEEGVDIRVYGQPPTFVTLGENGTAIRDITRLPRT